LNDWREFLKERKTTKLRNAVASNSYMGWGIWTPIFHNTWCIWTRITIICREFDLSKTSKSKFPGGMSRFRFDSRITGCIKKGNRTSARYCTWITRRMNNFFFHIRKDQAFSCWMTCFSCQVAKK
jgi:hypothetical protein